MRHSLASWICVHLQVEGAIDFALVPLLKICFLFQRSLLQRSSFHQSLARNSLERAEL